MWYHFRLLEHCNLKCSHCYAASNNREMKMSKRTFKEAIRSIYLSDTFCVSENTIYLSGGEPLLHEDFPFFISYAYRLFDKINLLTNGIKIPEFIGILNSYKDKLRVQVSLEGTEEINDQIRGKGVFKKVIQSLSMLHQWGINHSISYTVSRINKHCINDVINILKETNSLHNNISPYTGNPEIMLSMDEWEEFKREAEIEASKQGLSAIFHGTGACGFQYTCGEFFSGVTINPDGTLTGCARNPQKIYRHELLDEIMYDRPRLMRETCMAGKW